jgi:hypothetical protein
MPASTKIGIIIMGASLLCSCDSDDKSNIGKGIVTGIAAGVASSATHHAIQKWKDRRILRSFRRR